MKTITLRKTGGVWYSYLGKKMLTYSYPDLGVAVKELRKIFFSGYSIVVR